MTFEVMFETFLSLKFFEVICTFFPIFLTVFKNIFCDVVNFQVTLHFFRLHFFAKNFLGFWKKNLVTSLARPHH